MTSADAEWPDTEFEGQTVLITGGAGFIGSHLADALVPQADVRILDDLSSGHREYVPAAATFVEGDVRDETTVREAMKGVDLVFHEAAIVSVDESVDAPLLSHTVNVDGTLRVLEESRRQDARVIAASSAAIYGEPETVPVTEDEPVDPLSPYGLDKFAVDRYTTQYNDIYGLPTVVLRPFNAYGPRQPSGGYAGVIRVFLNQAQAGEPITVEGEGYQTRDFVHVQDLVQAYLRAASTTAVGEAFNIGTGEHISVLELAKIIRDVTGTMSEIVHTDPRPGDITHSSADISKARSKLGYEPTIDLCEGIEELAS